MNRTSPLSRPLIRLAMIAFAALFIMAPTPGDVGGCSESMGSQPLTQAPNMTAEETYFDESLCSAFCWRLRDCGVLCAALNPAPDNCDNFSQEAYASCVRGQLRADFFGGATSCPHHCPSNSRFIGATYYDVQACVDAVLSRNCNASGDGSIGTTFTNAPTECTNLCQ